MKSGLMCLMFFNNKVTIGHASCFFCKVEMLAACGGHK
jgi:hypothetical protein